jgi:hypothetical protein
VGIAQRTGFGLVSSLPGIWPSLRPDTVITLPAGVEVYAAYALRAWSDDDRSSVVWSSAFTADQFVAELFEGPPFAAGLELPEFPAVGGLCASGIRCRAGQRGEGLAAR